MTSSSGTPNGTVTFINGSTSLGTGTLNGSGVATLTTTALPVGTDTVTASYVATASFAVSSGTATVTVNAAIPAGFTLASAASTLSVAQGQSASTMLTLSPAGGYSGSVTFSCQNLPANAICIFAQSSVSLTGNDQPVKVGLTVYTDLQQARMSAMQKPGHAPLNPILPALAFGFPGSLAGLAAFGRKRKFSKTHQRWLQLCLLLAATEALAVGLSGCGGRGPVTPTGSSKVMVVATGTSGANVVTQNVVLTVTITQ